MLPAGRVLLCVGVARIMDLSPLVASPAAGGTMVNLAARSRRLFHTLARTDPPFSAICFVIAGADLDVSLVSSMGILGGYYLLARAVGKFWGAWFGARWLGLEDVVQRLLGFGLMAQAGLAVGLVLVINTRFPQYARVVGTVILSSVVIYEMFGPISTRFAIIRSGEARPHEPESVSVVD